MIEICQTKKEDCQLAVPTWFEGYLTGFNALYADTYDILPWQPAALIADYRYVGIAPLVLTAGQTYRVAALMRCDDFTPQFQTPTGFSIEQESHGSVQSVKPVVKIYLGVWVGV